MWSPSRPSGTQVYRRGLPVSSFTIRKASMTLHEFPLPPPRLYTSPTRGLFTNSWMRRALLDCGCCRGPLVVVYTMYRVATAAK
jgi:hypothetical protein